MKAQALKRNGEQNNVAIFGDLTFGLPDGIKAEVIVLNAFSGNSIHLNTKRVGKEFIGALTIVKSIKRDADRVIAGNVLPLHHVGAKSARVSLTDECYIKKAVVIRDISSSLLADRSAIVRLALKKFSDLKAGRLGIFTEIIFQFGNVVRTNGSDRWLFILC